MTAIHLLIHGRVQGVGFRAWVLRRARRHGLTGWVCNHKKRTVEIILCGDAEMVELMRVHCRRGPITARVSFVEERPWDGEIPRGFRIVKDTIR